MISMISIVHPVRTDGKSHSTQILYRAKSLMKTAGQDHPWPASKICVRTMQVRSRVCVSTTKLYLGKGQ